MTTNDNNTIETIYIQHFKEINTRCTPELMTLVRSKIIPHHHEIANVFYQAMLSINGSEGFLTKELVKSQLLKSMALWIENLFIIRSDTELLGYVDYLLTIGRVHARINLPPHLFNCGVRVLKQQICQKLRTGDVSLKEYNSTSTLATMLIDLCTSLMNESYFTDIVVGERKAQSLQMHLTGSELALKCEQLRSKTYSWHTKLLNSIRDNQVINQDSILPILKTDVGLWIIHKATLFFPNSEHVQKIKSDLTLIDQQLPTLINLNQSDNQQSFNATLALLDEKVMEITSALSSLVEHSISLESGRDPLTKLLNRRYLDTVLQRETQFCMIHKKSYIILMIDIDHFKNINDQYGHVAGDHVLGQIGELLSNEVRGGDFVFRYGGEEFLILLTDLRLEFIENITNKILISISNHEFKVNQQDPLQCTISIGVAAHQGHPDYNRVITNADKALYQAKESGRNKFIVYAE